ncbi:MAG: amidohydrolase, partial [Planctomycetaceae bacterium]
MRILTVMLMLSGVGGGVVNAQTADMLFSGGDILTMRGPAPEYVESLAVKDGTILFVGARADARRHVGPETKTVDLGGRTLLPGFIDTHGHFVYFGKNL